MYVFVFVALCCIAALLWQRKRVHLPKGYQHIPVSRSNVDPKSKRVDCTRDAYKLHKVPQDLDAIIIGSGMGGLVCAGLLAKCGKRVLVLEQHYVAGGCTHSFEEHGYEFDTGLHYMGNMHKAAALFDAISAPDHRLKWVRMGSPADNYCYDRIVLGKGGREFLYTASESLKTLDATEHYIRQLVKAFPHEEAGIRTYVGLMRQLDSSSRVAFILKLVPVWLGRLLKPLVAGKFLSLAAKTTEEVVHQCVKDPDLRSVLLGQAGDVGGPPSEASFFMQTGVSLHYLCGAWYPEGGSQELPRAIIPTIEYAGGRVLVRARVSKIIVDDASLSARGVEMDNGDMIYAHKVISATGALNTFQDLLSEKLLQSLAPTILPRLQRVGASVSHMYVFVGLKGSQEELKLPAHNTWFLPAHDLSAACHQYYRDPFSLDPMMFLGFPSAKDPSYSRRFPGKSCCILISEATWEMVKEWEDTEFGKRGAAYTQWKSRMGQRLVDEMVRLYPQLRDRIDCVEVASPLTNKFYLNTVRGSSYGLGPAPARFTECDDILRPATFVNNLYLTGQDVVSSGVMGAVYGGVLTAHAVLGYPSLLDVVTGRDLMKEIMALPPVRAAAQ